MPRGLRRSVSTALIAGALALTAVACGDETAVDVSASGSAAAPAEPAGPPETTPEGVSTDVPNLALFDVSTGDSVALRSLFPSETPVLMWFYAPH